MNRFEQVKAFVKQHKTEILVASGVLAGVIVGGICVYKVDRKEFYTMKKAFKNFNLEHKDKVIIDKIIKVGIEVPGSYTDEQFDEVYRIACRCGTDSSFGLRIHRKDFN